MMVTPRVMSWLPRPDLQARINRAVRELKLAREDGSCEWIRKSAKAVDDLLDEYLAHQPKENV